MIAPLCLLALVVLGAALQLLVAVGTAGGISDYILAFFISEGYRSCNTLTCVVHHTLRYMIQRVDLTNFTQWEIYITLHLHGNLH